METQDTRPVLFFDIDNCVSLYCCRCRWKIDDKLVAALSAEYVTSLWPKNETDARQGKKVHDLMSVLISMVALTSV